MAKTVVRVIVLGLALSSTACVFAVGGPRDWDEEWDVCAECAECVERLDDLEHHVHRLEKRVGKLEAGAAAHD